MEDLAGRKNLQSMFNQIRVKRDNLNKSEKSDFIEQIFRHTEEDKIGEPQTAKEKISNQNLPENLKSPIPPLPEKSEPILKNQNIKSIISNNDRSDDFVDQFEGSIRFESLRNFI